MKKTVRFHDSLICQSVQDYEQCSYLYSKSVAEEIFEEEDTTIDYYVKIKNGSKTIYRKCAAWRTVKSHEISLGNRSIRELGLTKKDLGKKEVEVKKSNWLAYQIHNSDRSKKIAFFIVLIGLFCTVFSTTKDIIELLF